MPTTAPPSKPAVQKTVVSKPLVIPDEFQEIKGPSLQGQYAGFISRATALIIDLLIVLLISTVVTLGTVAFLNFLGIDGFLEEQLPERQTLATLVRFLTALGGFGFIALVYSTIMTTITGGLSIGRALMGVRVVRLDGLPIGYLRSIGRYLAFIYLALLPLGLGLLWVLVDDRRQGWHDKVARTCVIYDWPAHETTGVISTMRARMEYLSDARNVRQEARAD